MRILQINNFHYYRAGADTVYLNTGNLLERMGHTVMYFSSIHEHNLSSKYLSYFVGQVDFYSKNSIVKNAIAAFSFIYSRRSALQLERLILLEKPEIAHLHIFQSRLTSSILPVLKKHNIPIIMTLHEYKMLCPTYLFLDTKNRICEKCSQSTTLHVIRKRCVKGSIFLSILSYLEVKTRDMFFPYERYVDRFLAVSDFLLNKHLQYKSGMKDKLFKLYNFIELSEYRYIAEKQGYYMFIGRLSVEKGILFLINSWRNFKDVPLLIVGDGPLKNQVEELIISLKLNHIKLLGYRNKSELIPIIQQARYTIVPSLCYETFGLTIIESMACGTPPIAARIGGMNELVHHGVNGLQFTSGAEKDFVDVITSSMSVSEVAYRTMSENGCQFVKENFGAEKYGGTLVDHYSEVIQQKKGIRMSITTA
jgi:glycosyltransferase involved in cell wall biosynthesis